MIQFKRLQDELDAIREEYQDEQQGLRAEIKVLRQFERDNAFLIRIMDLAERVVGETERVLKPGIVAMGPDDPVSLLCIAMKEYDERNEVKDE